ncbi:hypothetical protein B0H67DRAFT_481293, partial [Lasiosphaeris hirsuta]
NRKHQKNHKKPTKCVATGCTAGFAELKDMHRHMWTNHADQARALSIPNETRKCPDCDFKGRRDNLKRHVRTKHGSS